MTRVSERELRERWDRVADALARAERAVVASRSRRRRVHLTVLRSGTLKAIRRAHCAAMVARLTQPHHPLAPPLSRNLLSTDGRRS
jgi:hypothetical protein